MAKKKAAGGVNKSEIIRAYKSENPNAKPKEIVEAMAAAGVTVTAQTVSTVLSNAKKAAKKGKKADKAAGKIVKANAAATGDFDFIDAAERMVDLLGGTQALRVMEFVIRTKEGK